MTSWLRRLRAYLAGRAEVPADFGGTLEPGEPLLASARVPEGPLVATYLGLWVPNEVRRIGWHLVSKATWKDGVLTLVEAEQTGTAGDAVVLRDRPARRFPLTEPGRLPEVVHGRVTRSIRSSHHRELPGGGAWFVQRKVPGQDGVVLQVRPDGGTDEAAVAEFAAEAAARLQRAREAGQS